MSDPQEGQIGFFAKGTENGAPVLIATRLKVVNGQITEIESYVPRLTDTVGGGPSSTKRVDMLGDVTRKQFTTALPPDKRLSREKLASIANSYWAGLENNRGEKVPPFAADCLRLENGSQTSGVKQEPGAKRTTLNMRTCHESFELGYYREDTRMRSRRMLVIDEERGIVYAGCFFDHDATVRSYQVKDGTTRTVTNTGPGRGALTKCSRSTPRARSVRSKRCCSPCPTARCPAGIPASGSRASRRRRTDSRSIDPTKVARPAACSRAV